MKIKMSIIAFFVIALLHFPFGAKADDSGYIVKLKTSDAPDILFEILTEINAEHSIYLIDDVSKLTGFEKYIEYTEKNGQAVLIDSQPSVSLFMASDDEFNSNQWQLEMVKAKYVWDMATYGNEVNVAVIDTGCNNHEDISLAGGYNYVKKNENYSDNHGHGTHVSGIISALHNETGICGISPKVNIYALKCVDPGCASGVDEIADAIYDAVDIYNCKVISMSLGFETDYTALREAVEHAAENNVVIVAAVGNDGNKPSKSKLWYPAAYEETIGVGSVSATKKRSYFSQQNDSVFVVAPGENYLSTNGTSNYVLMSGTSQATPVVAGTVALLFSADEDITIADVKNFIKTCSEPLTDAYCGHGLLNIEAMFKECIKDKNYYISPINSDGIVVYNNTDSDLVATGILAKYSGSKYVSGSISSIELSPAEKVKIDCADAVGQHKFFLWSPVKNLYPLAEARAGNCPE